MKGKWTIANPRRLKDQTTKPSLAPLVGEGHYDVEALD